MPLQLRRGVEADRTTIVPANGELIYTTDTKQVYVGDGSTIGGTAVTGGSGLSFTTIAVAGQSNVVADSATDTLNLVAGSGVSITTNAATDTITITNTKNLVNDPDPTLGNHLDLNGFEIRSTRSNENIVLNPSGTGQTRIIGDISLSGEIVKQGRLNFHCDDGVTIGNTDGTYDGEFVITTNTWPGSSGNNFLFRQHHSSSDASNFVFLRTRGTAGAMQAVQNGDEIADIVFSGHDGITTAGAAVITVAIDGAVSSGKLPARMAFGVHNGTSVGNRLVISGNGLILLNQLGALTGTNITIPTNNSLTVGSVRLSQAGLSTTSSNENLVLDASGTGKVISTSSFEVSGTIGYATGTGGTITQSTNKTTGVTLDKACGTITTASGSINSGDEFSFTVTNSFVDDTDVVLVNIKSGGTAGAYLAQCDQVSNGSFRITVTNISNSTLDEILALNFIIVKSVSA